MKLTKRILCHAWKAKNCLVEWSVFALCLRIETIRPNRVTGCAETRHDLLTRDIEFLCSDNDAFGFSRSRRWFGAGRRRSGVLRDDKVSRDHQRDRSDQKFFHWNFGKMDFSKWSSG